MQGELPHYTSADAMYADLEAKARARARVKKSWWWRISQKRWFSDWKELTAAERVVMLTLWLRSGKSNKSWASMRRLAKDLHLSKTTCAKALASLEAKGFIKVEKKVSSRGLYNSYELLR